MNSKASTLQVCIAEKPSVAREIAYIIGANARRDGYFEGNGYAVTWTYGHFCMLCDPDDYRPEWKRWHIHSLPMLPEQFATKLKSDTGIRKQFKIIKTLLKNASLVINCGDAGQEGELIQRWVLKEAKYKGRVQRLWISSLTREAIQAGFQDLREASAFDRLYDAGSARAIGDWLLGINATRLYTLKYGMGRQMLSVGRVQTPTLAMLVNRHKEIENFVSTPFWELQTLYREVVFRYEKGRFEDQDKGRTLLGEIENAPFTITSFEKKKGKEYAPRLFDLTGLQVFCNKRFGYSAEQTLNTVQKLYEKKVVTYPRVDTTYLPNDVYPKIKKILEKLTDYQDYTAPLLQHPIRKSKRVFDDGKVTDHHAIIPTGERANLSYDEGRIYDAIARSFIANFYPECEVSNTTVTGVVKEIPFKATGKEIIHPTWKVLFPKTEKDTKEEGSDQEDSPVLPLFKIGESGPHDPALIQKQTQPPKYYTEATLLRAMETAGKTLEDEEIGELMKENGIGRPSTRANIIETLFKRMYAIRKRKLVMATDLGIQLIDTIQDPLLKSVELTGQWEQKLRQIEAGDYSITRFIAEMKAMTTSLVEAVRSAPNQSSIDMSQIPMAPPKRSKYSTKQSTGRKTKAASSPKTSHSSNNRKSSHSSSKTSSKTSSIIGHTCPKCRNGQLIKGKTAFGCSAYKSGCSLQIPFKYLGKSISENQIRRLLTKGSTVKLKGFIINGKPVTGIVTWSPDYRLQLQESTTTPPGSSNKKKKELTCPRCHKGKLIRGKNAYGCSEWKAGCDYRYAYEAIRHKAQGQTLTAALVERILMNQDPK